MVCSPLARLEHVAPAFVEDPVLAELRKRPVGPGFEVLEQSLHVLKSANRACRHPDTGCQLSPTHLHRCGLDEKIADPKIEMRARDPHCFYSQEGPGLGVSAPDGPASRVPPQLARAVLDRRAASPPA